MELFSPEFFPALGAIIVVNLVLSGDNAIVIALAARNLPQRLRTRAVVWGTVGAVAGRSMLTVVVVWLLRIPGLMFAGGLMLVWIAWKLIIDNDAGDGEDVEAASGFWGAMKTIVAADVLMSLDNVLAVAGAANGHFGLVVLGLVISIPIVVFGSQLFLRFLERYPVIVYFGAGVLAWTSVKMMAGEPALLDYLNVHPALVWGGYLAVVGGVVGGGLFVNHGKLRERVMRHVEDLTAAAGVPPPAAGARHAVLVPVDGSASALQGVRHVAARALAGQAVEVHLVNVRTPFSQYLARFLSPRDRMAYHRYAGERALRAARRLLEDAGVWYVAHVELGPRAETIDRLARRLQVGEIVLGTARKNSLTRLLEDSVTASLLQRTALPVRVIPGNALPLAERALLAVAALAMAAALYGAFG